MARWHSRILLTILVMLCAAEVGCAWRKRAQEKREATYQSSLRSYSEILKPGMTRKEVEDYFHSKNTKFGQLCCIDERSAYADVVKIGKEGHPWYCEEHNVYVAFQFAALEPHDRVVASDSDTLKKITVFHQLWGCL
jgi:hypothetical protein